MNQVNMHKSGLFDYKAVIFDLDGTLYYQKPFRIRMLFYLAGHMLAHPSSIRDVFLIKKYREIRENWESHEKESFCMEEVDLDSRQYDAVAKMKGVSPQRVRKAVEFFMLEAPLKLLPSYRDDVLAEAIGRLRSKGVKVVIYSDYPVKDKLKALGIKADAYFTAADEDIGCMKPAPKGLNVILKKLGLEPEEAVMIGDRYEKDGLAAKSNQMDYVILSASCKERHKNDLLWL